MYELKYQNYECTFRASSVTLCIHNWYRYQTLGLALLIFRGWQLKYVIYHKMEYPKCYVSLMNNSDIHLKNLDYPLIAQYMNIYYLSTESQLSSGLFSHMYWFCVSYSEVWRSIIVFWNLIIIAFGTNAIYYSIKAILRESSESFF